MTSSSPSPRKPNVVGLFNTSIADPVERIQAYLDGYAKNPDFHGWDLIVMQHTKVISAIKTQATTTGTETHVVFEIEIVPGMCSSMGNAHDGMIATMSDNTTSMAAGPMAEEGFWDFGGLSRTLNITYLRPIPQGIVVRSENFVRSALKRLCAIQCVMKDKATGKVLALAEHNKAALDDEGRKERRAPGSL